MTFPYEKEARKPQIEVTQADFDLVKFTLTDTDISMANMLRRIMLAEVPSLAIEMVNVIDNDSVLFDEFIAHRMGLMPLVSHGVGDLPVDEGYVEHKDCTCFDGCPFCTVEFKLDVFNDEDKVLQVTHFDVEETHKYRKEKIPDNQVVRPIPFHDTKLDEETDVRENGIVLCKLKKDQRLNMVCAARKGIPKYHSKFMPVATAIYNYQPKINLKQDMLDALTLDEKVEFVKCCPRNVYELDIEDRVVIGDGRLRHCHFCDECVTKAKEFGKKEMVTVTQDFNMFHFTVEGVTPDGPRDVREVVRAALRIFDYKLSLFLKDTWGDEIKEWLPQKPYV